MAASWPTSIPTDATLYIAVNELQTNLSSGINDAVTTLTINSTTSFPTVGLVLIDNEIIKYTGVSGSTLTGCTRGFDGTTAASHSTAAVVSFAICAQHHNVSKDEIIALATYLSNNLGTGAQPLANGSRALASNGSGKIIESSVTSTELGYLSGVTSAIQTQLNLLAPKASPTFTGTVTTPLTANRAVATGAAGVLAASATTDTELGYVSGVTSALQTQLNAKAASTDIKYYAAPVYAESTTLDSVTSSTFQNTSLAASIAPAASAHRIKITVTATIRINAATSGYFTIKRGSTDLGIAANGGIMFLSTQNTSVYATLSIVIIDSPSTTSSTTYTVCARSADNTNAVQFCASGKATIVLEEVA